MLRNAAEIVIPHAPIPPSLQDAIIQRYGLPRETREKEGLRITNQLTQKSVLLNPSAEIFWELLGQPIAFKELTELLSEACAAEKQLDDFLQNLLDAKLISTS